MKSKALTVGKTAQQFQFPRAEEKSNAIHFNWGGILKNEGEKILKLIQPRKNEIK